MGAAASIGTPSGICYKALKGMDRCELGLFFRGGVLIERVINLLIPCCSIPLNRRMLHIHCTRSSNGKGSKHILDLHGQRTTSWRRHLCHSEILNMSNRNDDTNTWTSYKTSTSWAKITGARPTEVSLVAQRYAGSSPTVQIGMGKRLNAWRNGCR